MLESKHNPPLRPMVREEKAKALRVGQYPQELKSAVK